MTGKNWFNYHVWSLLVAILRKCGFSKIWCRIGNGRVFKWIPLLKWKHFVGELDIWTQASSDAEIGARLLIRSKKPSPVLGNCESQSFGVTIRKQISLTNPLLGVLFFGWSFCRKNWKCNQYLIREKLSKIKENSSWMQLLGRSDNQESDRGSQFFSIF